MRIGDTLNNASKFTLKICKFRILENMEVPLDTYTVLYGPNNGGKTTILHSIANLLQGPITDELSYISSGIDEADMELVFDTKTKIHIINGIYTVQWRDKEVSGSYNSIAHIIHEIMKEQGIKDIGYVRGDKVYILNGSSELNIWSKEDWSNILLPANIDKLFKHIDFFRKYFDYKIQYLLPEKYKVNGVWIDPRLIPYGFRRALMIMYAVSSCDMVLVESFESGMHVDLVVKLMDWLNEMENKYIIIETHSGLVLRYALSLDWKAHYIERGKSRFNLKLNDLSNIELFKREIDTLYKAI